jgi:hypothetical protein
MIVAGWFVLVEKINYELLTSVVFPLVLVLTKEPYYMVVT